MIQPNYSVTIFIFIGIYEAIRCWSFFNFAKEER